MNTQTLKYITGSLLGTAFIFLLLAIAVGTANGDNGVLDQVNDNRKTIYDAQINAESAHVSLEKARAVVAAAVEAEQKAQSIVDSYSNTARTARENICRLGKDHCTNANLDPAGNGVNIQEFFTLAR